MVAFVRMLPSMSPAEYERLAHGPTGRVAGGAPGNLEDALPTANLAMPETAASSRTFPS
jgi:hypothetical protein